jgi:hypothetical protein
VKLGSVTPTEEQFEDVLIKGAEENASMQDGGCNNTLMCITRNFIISIIYQILIGKSNQGERQERDSDQA